MFAPNVAEGNCRKEGGKGLDDDLGHSIYSMSYALSKMWLFKPIDFYGHVEVKILNSYTHAKLEVISKSDQNPRSTGRLNTYDSEKLAEYARIYTKTAEGILILWQNIIDAAESDECPIIDIEDGLFAGEIMPKLVQRIRTR